MRLSSINSAKSISLKDKQPCAVKNTAALIENMPTGQLCSYNAQNLKANYMPINFCGNAQKIKNAFIITENQKDVPLLQTRQNNSYIVDFDSQTEIVYGIDAVKFLDLTDEFEYDTQVIVPKKCEGVLHIDEKNIPLKENSAVLINAGTKANVEITKGQPMMVVTKKDYQWYERYGKDAKDLNIKNKFLELMYFNSHLFNGEFTLDVLLPDKLRDGDFLKSLSVDKWESRGNIVQELYDKKDLLDEKDAKTVEFIKETIDKLYEKKVIIPCEDEFVKFKECYTPQYNHKILLEKGFTEEQIRLFASIYNQTRMVKLDSKFAIKNSAKDYSPELIRKMKDKDFFYDNKKDADENVYWKKCFGNETSLRQALLNAGFSKKEQDDVVDNWYKINNTGFDLSGLKFINQNAAVYNLDDKLNNWTHEKTNWLTNSTAISSTDGKTPFIGVSMVQSDEEKVIKMSDIRREEKLHVHPNLDERRQAEIYMITSGSAALNLVRDGKPCIKVLKEGDLAVVAPGVPHCINSIKGEYEHIVTQIPSAFQYGFGFKQIVEPPEGYDEEELYQEAINSLN